MQGTIYIPDHIITFADTRNNGTSITVTVMDTLKGHSKTVECTAESLTATLTLAMHPNGGYMDKSITDLLYAEAHPLTTALKPELRLIP